MNNEQPMTLDRRAEIDAFAQWLEYRIDHVSRDEKSIEELSRLQECLAEIDRLTTEDARLQRVVDQAIECGGINQAGIYANPVTYPELASELEKRIQKLEMNDTVIKEERSALTNEQIISAAKLAGIPITIDRLGGLRYGRTLLWIDQECDLVDGSALAIVAILGALPTSVMVGKSTSGYRLTCTKEWKYFVSPWHKTLIEACLATLIEMFTESTKEKL